MTSEQNPCNILMILDGWGINESDRDNAVATANTPFLDRLIKDFPMGRLDCSGPAVGLPQGTMGNSEVGHMNIGAGRVVPQDLARINAAIQDKTFFENKVLKGLMGKIKEKGTALHLLGLLSDGGVHSHINHLFALVDMAAAMGLRKVYIHVILDGRDTSPTSGADFVARLQEKLNQTPGSGKVASIVGRYWAMDRDTRWDRVEKAYDLLTRGKGLTGEDPESEIRAAYDRKQTDEFIPPILIGDPGQGRINDGDGLVFFNFRADRAKEITRAFNEDGFSEFSPKVRPQLAGFVTMTRYDANFNLPQIFGPQHLEDILGEVLSRENIPQLRIAETEKYAHVTYFFNGGEETPFPLEERVLIPSPRDVATYDLKPEMSAEKVADAACKAIRSGKFKFVVLNFANMDMVGHSGIFEAAVKACEAVDACVKQVVTAIWETSGTAFVTADHGNSEQMKAPDGSPHTAHTLNQVRFIVAGERFKATPVQNGKLGDIAPTILKAMGIPLPGKMTGTPLI